MTTTNETTVIDLPFEGMDCASCGRWIFDPPAGVRLACVALQPAVSMAGRRAATELRRAWASSENMQKHSGAREKQ